MRFGLVNQSKRLHEKNVELAAICGAVTQQVIVDAAPLWGWIPKPVTLYRSDEKIPGDVFPLYLRDALSEDGALGYHAEGFGEIGVNVVLDNGGTIMAGSNSISAVVSHEVLEALGDLAVNLWADMDDGRQTARELCDAVENDSYTVHGVAVSNFLLPSWFDGGMLRGKTPYDYMRLLKKPFSMRPGGYWIVRDIGTGESSEWGKKRVEFGEEFPEWKKAHKLRKGSRAARRIGEVAK